MGFAYVFWFVQNATIEVGTIANTAELLAGCFLCWSGGHGITISKNCQKCELVRTKQPFVSVHLRSESAGLLHIAFQSFRDDQNLLMKCSCIIIFFLDFCDLFSHITTLKNAAVIKQNIV